MSPLRCGKGYVFRKVSPLGFSLSTNKNTDAAQSWVASVFLTTVVNAARNMAYKYTFDSLLLILLGIYPEMKLLDHIVILYLIF